MKASEIREMTAAELETKLKDLKAELFNRASSLLLISSITRCASPL